MYMDAVISIGCVIFSVLTDTILKPLKWVAGSPVEIVKKSKIKSQVFKKRQYLL